MNTVPLSPQMQMLSTNMMFTMRTGDILIDSIISMLIAGMLVYIVQFKDTAFSYTKRIMSKLLCERSRITFNGRVYTTRASSNGPGLSENFLAVSDWVAKGIRANEFRNASSLGEVHIPRSIQQMLSHSLTMGSVDSVRDDDEHLDHPHHRPRPCSGAAVTLNQTEPIYHKTHDIMVRSECVEKAESEEQSMFTKSKISYTEHNLHISSNSMDVTELMQFVSTRIVEPFQAQKRQNEKNKLFYFLFDRHHAEDEELPSYDRYEWYSTKRYKHVISEHTDTVKNRVDRFLTDRSWYVEHGKPHSLTIMLYGPPGCGKTSIIKAVANHTKRHIKEIPLPRVKSRQTLMEIFHGTRVDYKMVRPQDCIFVFEEFDKMGDVVMNDEAIAAAAAAAARLTGSTSTSSSSEVASSEITNAVQTALTSMGTKASVHRRGKGKEDEEPPLSIGDILNVMDGLLEHNGIITFFTANKISHLHEAILRPGRIDLKLEFGKSSAHNLKQILRSVFGVADADGSAADALFEPIDRHSELFDRKWSPAEIEELCFGCANISDTVKTLLQMAGVH
jgi:SpoVK/Ycf46/Vps4 family AAA+-type ATPase